MAGCRQRRHGLALKRDANVTQQVLTTGTMPTSAEELQGKTEYVAPKAFDVSQDPGGCLLAFLGWRWWLWRSTRTRSRPGSARCSTWQYYSRLGSEAYGVVFDGAKDVDMEATEKRRAKLRKARYKSVPKRERRKVDTTHARRIAEGLCLSDGIIACSKCAQEISPVKENYKFHCAMTERPVKGVNPYLLDPKVYVDDKMVFRSYACPSCGLLIQTELVRPTDPPLWDIQLA